MGPSNMNNTAGWSSLLAESVRRFKGILGVARRLAAKPPPMRAHVALAAVDEAVAALAALRGSAECRDLFPEIQPLMTQIIRKLSMFPDSVDPVSMMTLFCVNLFSEAVAAPLESSDFDVRQKLDDIMTYRDASALDRVTTALICLNFDRVYDVKLLAAKTDKTALSLIKALAVRASSGSKELEAAWEAYLRAFPRSLQAKTAEWRQLLLAARLVLGKRGGIPAGEVADTLQRRIKMIADAESK